MSENFYITTPIYYVNDVPHIGSAYTTLICDVIARFKRAEGYDVKFLTGTDEHGQKIETTAKKKNIATQDFVNEIAKRFEELCPLMNFSNDDFIRTTQERHIEGAQEFWRVLEKKGYIYKGEYAGWYAIKDEAFYTEAEIIDGKAPTGAEVEWVTEESYFFKLSVMQDKLLELYKNNPEFVYPKSRQNEVIKFVEQGLEDLSISRTSFDWGVKVPGDDKHVMYVWLDALTNYITALGYPDIKSKDFQKFWPANIHMVGKDITRFHAIYWPAFLMAAEIELPKQIVSHGWWLIEGEKMSKSTGNVVSPVDLVDKYGLDETRYYLMREIPFGQDGNFSSSTLQTRINGELANKVGNLVQRTLTLVYKNCDQKIPAITQSEVDLSYDQEIMKYAQNIFTNVKEKFDKHEYHKALDLIMGFADKANEYIDQAAPWALKKTDLEAMNRVLYVLCELIRYIAILLYPFIPGSSEKVLYFLGLQYPTISFKYLSKKYSLKPGSAINEPKVIFRKIV